MALLPGCGKKIEIDTEKEAAAVNKDLEGMPDVPADSANAFDEGERAGPKGAKGP